MDNIDLCGYANLHLICSVALEHYGHEGINNSSITKLEACHYPEHYQRKKINSLLERFCHSDSIRDIIAIKKELSNELKEMRLDIAETREKTFEIINRGTEQVHGVLRTNFTTNDRDNYIKKLMYYREAQEKIADITEKYYEGNFAIPLEKLGGHHSSSLWGDMDALERILDGGTARVPDLTYNVGHYHYG